MPPHSRGTAVPSGFQSKSTPNLPTLRSLGASTTVDQQAPASNAAHQHSPVASTSPSEPASIEDNAQDEDEVLFSFNPSSGSDSEDSDANPPTSRPLYTSRSHTQLPPHTASTLFPPFYNRPPTPLPPSPSLTSLLRPSFSTQTSRPTTPDSSDVELPIGTGATTNGASTPTTNLASITKSARHAPTVPRASPKVPTYEYYGFALYLASSAAFLMYILWAYVPSPLLHQMGIHYYPNRWWALAVPAWLVVLVMYIYVALASYNTRYLTLPLSNIENLVDEHAQVAVVDTRTGKIARNWAAIKSKSQEKDRGGRGSAAASRSNSLAAYQFARSDDVDWRRLWSTGTDAVMDVPIGGVCEILYGTGREPEE
ncbi:PIG-P-domain-containing protein [Delitschia confertaspora ATCC 74209]|uniref:PIG-P-domain-containing protein n=1 Tax=Delitschia confertaspora ATCC 74209 TaxID=1513339 RepID=A0A9P4JUY6_9PLEO|nr:PIG-P-domain-containing protein [Delitschia confertaspora ATCC 74209]